VQIEREFWASDPSSILVSIWDKVFGFVGKFPLSEKRFSGCGRPWRMSAPTNSPASST
jgi:hypothetical protein